VFSVWFARKGEVFRPFLLLIPPGVVDLMETGSFFRRKFGGIGVEGGGGTIGHVDHGKTTLTAAITKVGCIRHSASSMLARFMSKLLG
jgi:hypothetical protein